MFFCKRRVILLILFVGAAVVMAKSEARDSYEGKFVPTQRTNKLSDFPPLIAQMTTALIGSGKVNIFLNEESVKQFTDENLAKWIAIFDKLENVVDDLIAKMPSKYDPLKVSGMDPVNQALVRNTIGGMRKYIKDVFEIAKPLISNLDGQDATGRVDSLISNLEGISACRTQASSYRESIKSAIKKLDPKSNDKKQTKEVKETLRSILRAIETMFDKLYASSDELLKTNRIRRHVQEQQAVEAAS